MSEKAMSRLLNIRNAPQTRATMPSVEAAGGVVWSSATSTSAAPGVNAARVIETSPSSRLWFPTEPMTASNNRRSGNSERKAL